MKKFRKVLLLTGVLTGLLCVSAMAAETEVSSNPGLYGVNPANGVILNFYTESDGSSAIESSSAVIKKGESPVSGFYQNAVRFEMTADGATANDQYLLLVLNSKEVPNANNIVYINQATANAEGKVSFTGTDMAYPSSLTATEYYVYLVGDGMAFQSDNPTVSFSSYVPYTLGDVDDSGKINTNDAVVVLKHCAEIEMLEVGSSAFFAADVDRSNAINTNDAVQILKYVAELIDNFD